MTTPVSRVGNAAAFMSHAPAPAPRSGNTDWADRYAAELRRVFHEHAARAPRTLQRHLGPSEIGSPCHREIAGKLAGIPETNHVMDPWPSIRGTALHAYAEEAFQGDNARRGPRWLTETRVQPFDPIDDQDGHSGTADLYDGLELSLVDHKFLGEASLRKVRQTEGPPRKYVVQLKLYARGYRRKGLPVNRVVLAAYPATKASLDDLYVWEDPYTSADDELLAYVEQELDYRKQWATLLISGQAQLLDVPHHPDDSNCVWCPFLRPQSARDGGVGCPGHAPSTPLGVSR